MDQFWYGLLLVIDIFCVIFGMAHVLLRQPDARSASFWAVIICFVPVIGVIFYAIFGINSLRRRGQQYRSANEVDKTVMEDACPIDPREEAPSLNELHGLAETLGRVSRMCFTGGNRVQILHSGDEAMPAMLEAIKGAEKSITLSSYIFEATGIGEKFVEELGKARTRGVEVRVMVDDAGTRYSWPPVTRLLRKAGVTAKRYMPLRFILRILTMNLRNHRKIMVVDGLVGFTGGMNIRQGNMLSENPQNPLHDMHFKVEGPVVRQLQRVFAEDWAFCAGEVLAGDIWYPELKPMGDVAAIGIPDGPDEDMEIMPKAIFAALSAAKKEVCVLTPYFLPSPTLIWALDLASLRGVKVTIITPKNNNIRFVRWAARTLYPSMLEKGVHIYEAEGHFDHSKFMTVDGSWSLIGSTNWDPRSLRLNFEFNLACFDEKLAGQLNAVFAEKLTQSKAVTMQDLEAASLFERLRDGAARMFMPLL
ncbi:cardiolipin synthase [soil metagenome]